jgi:hypothetical protein
MSSKWPSRKPSSNPIDTSTMFRGRSTTKMVPLRSGGAPSKRFVDVDPLHFNDFAIAADLGQQLLVPFALLLNNATQAVHLVGHLQRFGEQRVAVFLLAADLITQFSRFFGQSLQLFGTAAVQLRQLGVLRFQLLNRRFALLAAPGRFDPAGFAERPERYGERPVRGPTPHESAGRSARNCSLVRDATSTRAFKPVLGARTTSRQFRCEALTASANTMNAALKIKMSIARNLPNNVIAKSSRSTGYDEVNRSDGVKRYRFRHTATNYSCDKIVLSKKTAAPARIVDFFSRTPAAKRPAA